MQNNGNSNTNAQGVVPGYQPLRTTAPRSNTAGKHGAQQQLNPHATGVLPTTSQGQRAGIKFKKTISGGVSHQTDAGGVAASSSMIGQQYMPHSNPNFNDAQTSGQVFEKSSKPIDRSDPQLKKSPGTHGSSPRPGAGQIKIQQIIRGHYQGGSNTGGNNSSNATQMLNANQHAGKSKSTNQRPLRSSRQQISPSIVNQLQANNPLQGGFDGASNSFQGAKMQGANNGSNSSRLPTSNHGMVQHSMTQNQTPNISNFHPPAIQKHEMSGGRQNSRRNARHAQISKNHPDLMVQNSIGAHPQQQTTHFSYGGGGKQRGSQNQSNSIGQSQQMQQHYHHSSNATTAAQDTSGSGSNGKYMRPNTASETRKFMQHHHGNNNNTGIEHIGAGPQAATVGSPLLPPNRHGGLVVPQPNGSSLISSQQDPNGILAASSRRRGHTNSGTPGGYQASGSMGATTATSNQARSGRQTNISNDGKNPMSLSHDQPLPHRRPAKEDTLFLDKKGQTVLTGSHAGGLGGPNSPQQPHLNTINGFSGNERNGATTSRVPISQSLDHSFIRNSGPPIQTTNSASQINQLGQHSGNSHSQQQNQQHQRITSQHNQSIPQYRKANLRDLRKSQRLSHNNATNHQLVNGGPSSKENQINPLTSVELNQHFVKQRQNHQGGQRSSKDMQQQISSNHGGSTTGRSLDHAKRQLIMPNSGSSGGNPGQGLTSSTGQSSQQQMNSFHHNVQVNKSLQPSSSTGTHGPNLQQNSNNNGQTQNLIPSGYKRRSKRPGQSLNQAPLNFGQNQLQGGSTSAITTTTGSETHHQNNMNNQHKDSLSYQPNSRKQRLELTSINSSHHQRGSSSDHHHQHQQQPLTSERGEKHSRHKQNNNNLISNSLDGAFQKRIPSVNSINNNGSNASSAAAAAAAGSNNTPGISGSHGMNGPQQSHHPHSHHHDHDEQISTSHHNQTPKGTSTSNKEPQKPQRDDQQMGGGQAGNERFNAITKFAFATSQGYQPGNPYKVNQDTYTLAPNMCGQQGFHLFVVCDGHGINGHKVSGDIKQELPKELEQKLSVDQDFLDNTMSREFSERIPRYFRDSFSNIHEQLMTNKPYDCNLSGSTVCAVMFDSLRIYCANAGDSRAVLYTQGKKGGLKVTPLSEDHKPSLPKERMRVEKVGGRVNPIIGPQGQHLGPDRVWMATEDTPGLAMSRSLGDGLAHTLGVSWEPEVKQLVLEPSDKFIVIASDGVWEFLSNEQIARIVWPFYIKNSPEQAGNAIVRASAQKWKENDTVIDDITCITIFLEVD